MSQLPAASLDDIHALVTAQMPAAEWRRLAKSVCSGPMRIGLDRSHSDRWRLSIDRSKAWVFASPEALAAAAARAMLVLGRLHRVPVAIQTVCCELGATEIILGTCRSPFEACESAPTAYAWPTRPDEYRQRALLCPRCEWPLARVSRHSWAGVVMTYPEKR